MHNTFNAIQKRFIRMSPEEYLKKREEQPSSIMRVNIVPPSMTDDDDYGSFVVEVSNPAYEVDL